MSDSTPTQLGFLEPVESVAREEQAVTESASESVSEPRVLAPMLQQYQELKKQYPDYIILFQVGDFYELFFEDARVVSDTLNIRLTSRDRNSPDPIPMCGVPIHAIESYLPKLVTAGFRLVLFSQVEESGSRKGMVKREVSRIITPGVRLDGEGLEQSQTNYLAALVFHSGIGSVAYVDVSTGQLKLREVETLDELTEALEQISPAELILPLTVFGRPVERAVGWCREVKQVAARINSEVIYRPFDRAGESIVLEHLRGRMSSAETLHSLHEAPAESLSALEVLLLYVDEVSFGKPPQLSIFRRESGESALFLDGATRRNLELFETRMTGERRHSLIGAIDYTKTAMGGRLLREWISEPSRRQSEVEDRHQAVQSLLENAPSLAELRFLLLRVRDLDRILSRVTALRASPRDLAALGDSIAILPRVKELLDLHQTKLLGELQEQCDPLTDLSALIVGALLEEPSNRLNEGGIFREGYHKTLDELRALERDGSTLLTALEGREREAVGIPSLKVRYTSVFGYFIEVSRAHSQKVPPRYERRQTLANAERFITPELKELEVQLLSARGRQIELERELFSELRALVASHSARIHRTSRVLAVLDVIASFAECARERGFIRPTLGSDEEIRIVGGRHPVVEEIVGVQNFVPNDVHLNSSNRRFAILNGPNMGGKSTYLRQVAIIQILAQAGSFVPAEDASLPMVDRIFTRIGASDDLSRGDSTFMVEMREASTILRKATEHSLVLIDEIGRGTATADGLALALAISEWLHEEIRCKTIFATHFHELTTLPESRSGMFPLSVGILERDGEIEFTHRIQESAAARSYGIEVARLAGLPRRLVDRAAELLNQGVPTLSVPPAPIHREASPNVDPISRQRAAHFETIVGELSGCDCNGLTPVEALIYLDRLVKRAKNLQV